MDADHGNFHSSQVASTSTNEDADYVNAVMSSSVVSQNIDGQRTIDKRKRQPSSELQELACNSKKLKGQTSEPSMAEIAELIRNLDQSVTTRMNKLEDSLMVKLRECVMEEINQVRDSFNQQIKHLSDRLEAIESRADSNATPGNGSSATTTECFTIVFRNIPAHPIENVAKKTNTLIRDGLGIPDINVISAERKISRSDRPGVVVAKCESVEHVKMILDNKSKLKASDRYQQVYISRDIPRSERIMNANMRTLIDIIGKDKLELKGPFVTRKRRHNNNNNNNDNSSNNNSNSNNSSNSGNNNNNGRHHAAPNDDRRGRPANTETSSAQHSNNGNYGNNGNWQNNGRGNRGGRGSRGARGSRR